MTLQDRVGVDEVVVLPVVESDRDRGLRPRIAVSGCPIQRLPQRDHVTVFLAPTHLLVELVGGRAGEGVRRMHGVGT